ncbi:MAG: PIG-L deacetylase family protein [Nitrospinota bacterium]|nr:PIG-L deacetylase family protein [Nitrospinota bacterium]MDP6365788.1 PIG-L deacetylase family protein [Nitrospinota bacterium]MDP7168730.1 PIG-L deacetylase family protein [Nitrospinota bacterium]MDP7370926.1 PIG-L deacetylase family protein [Nitrospinota bacterium]MDP7662316.1 PIG-L deacetylase family protein [Nitrospinota bacterium]
MIRSEFKNIMVVVAHHDDAELGVGGSIAKWTEDGGAVHTVICTNGDKGTKKDIPPYKLTETREREQLAASKVLGVKDTIFLRHRDGELEDTRAFRNQIAFLIRHLKPDTVVMHDPWLGHYSHPDHQAVGHAAFKGVIYARDHHFLPELTYAGIEAHHTNTLIYTRSNEPNFFVDISETIGKKIKSINAHKSQIHNPRDTERRVRIRAEEAGAVVGLPMAENFTIKRLR